ncbi:hypothetical protein PQR39_41390 [Paraburkholderia sediminicola]|uniref:hypothetical protein n=1 Tax=Paraburkholderia sediminicola TaxID=458836 RepID=UPI0038B8C78F
MDIDFYKAPSRGSSHRGARKNSVSQQFLDAEGVVQNLMDDMFKKTGELNAARTKAASSWKYRSAGGAGVKRLLLEAKVRSPFGLTYFQN